jgi:hypothetical protein
MVPALLARAGPLDRSAQMNGPFSLAFTIHTLPQSNCLADELTYLELIPAGTRIMSSGPV